MRKWLAVFILFLLPLQLTWAAMGNYCQHENGSATPHIGHHVHKHSSQIGESGQPDKAKAGSADTDCGTCHTGCSIALPSALSATAAPSSLDFVALRLMPRTSPPLAIPDRPQWARPV